MKQLTIIAIIFICVFLYCCSDKGNPTDSNSESPVLYGKVLDENGNAVDSVGVHYIFDFDPPLSGRESRLAKTCPTTPVYFSLPDSIFHLTLIVYKYGTRELIDTLIHDSDSISNYIFHPDSLKLTNGLYICRLITKDTTYEK